MADPQLRGRRFAEAYTARIEEWLRGLLDTGTGELRDVALVALGGQGRRELAPQSDLDLLLLHRGSPTPTELAEQLWYPIWDEGFKLGHAVRTIADTLSLASEDLHTATALLTARHICGDGELTLRLRERARASFARRSRRWTSLLSEDTALRHRSAGEVAFALEPDLKSGRGGMRDVHALHWLAVTGEPVDPRLLSTLAEPFEQLLEVRVQLHRVQGRPGDVLVLQEQDAVASSLGLDGADELMALVSAAARSVAEVTDEVWYDTRSRSAGVGSRLGRRDRRLGEALVSRSGRVALLDELRPPADPFACLDVAVTAAREGQRISRSTLNALVGAPLPPEPPRSWPPEARERFVELLLLGHDAVDVIEVLVGRGLWTRLLPEWRPAVSRPQRNAYHRFTVDRHLLESAAVAAGLSGRVSRPDLLVLAALLHDMAKAHPQLGDHSAAGAPMAAGVLRRMGYDDHDVETVEVLVARHLLLAEVATRRDVSDPASAEYVASVLGSVDRIELLLALTEADGVATGPSAWSPWRSDLVGRLARAAIAVLGGPERSADNHPAEGRPRGASRESAAAGPDRSHLLAGSGVCIEATGSSLAVAYDPRSDGFARIAGVLALHHLDVLAASVRSEGGRELAEFTVDAGTAVEPRWDRVTGDLRAAMCARLALRSRLADRSRSLRPGHVAAHQFEPSVRFDNATGTARTVVEVVGPDSTGLLYRLARTLGEFDLSVTGAHIHTMGVDVVDSFYVETPGGGLLTDEGLQAELRRALLEELHPVVHT